MCVPMFVVELGFLGANIPKIPHGGWFALARGRRPDGADADLASRPSARGRHASIAVSAPSPRCSTSTRRSSVCRAPACSCSRTWARRRRRSSTTSSTTRCCIAPRSSSPIDTVEEPRVAPEERTEITKVEPGVFQVLLRYGFMEEPDVPAALAGIEHRGLVFDPDDVTYFIGRESIISGKAPGMHPAFEHLFVWLNRGADSAVRFFNLPPERVFEVGSRVEI